MAAYEMQLAILQQMAEDEYEDAQRRKTRDGIRNQFKKTQEKHRVKFSCD